jgi:hypothetical protein
MPAPACQDKKAKPNPEMRKFEAAIPQELWARYEGWAEGRGSIKARQLLIGMLRLFLNSPEAVQLAAIGGTEEYLREQIFNGNPRS